MTWEGRGIFEVSSADPDSAAPVWVDLTLYVNDVVMTPTLRTGRQNDLDQAEPSQLQLVLNNADDRFTYGNTSSPYAAWWGPGRRCRYRDVIAGTVVSLFVGFLQTPTEGLVTAGIDQRISIAAVDRLGRLQNSRTFISTLAEHIIYNAGTAVRGYWPFSQIPSADYFKLSDQAQWTDSFGSAFGSGVAADSGASSISVGGPVAADELPVVSLLAATGTFGGQAIITAAPEILAIGPWPIAAGQVVTLVGWFNPALPADPRVAAPLTLYTNTSSIEISFPGPAGAPLQMDCSGALVGSLAADYLPNGQWTPIAFRYDYTVPSLEMWIRSARYTVPLVGAPPASESLSYFRAPSDYAGQVGHAQLYVGTDYTYPKFLAQYQMAYTVLERQTTGDRIRLIAQYAGIPDAELQIDKGQSIMQAASLAGQTPLEAMRDAERTEQGLLYADGSGNLVFKDRRTLYNI